MEDNVGVRSVKVEVVGNDSREDRLEVGVNGYEEIKFGMYSLGTLKKKWTIERAKATTDPDPVEWSTT